MKKLATIFVALGGLAAASTAAMAADPYDAFIGELRQKFTEREIMDALEDAKWMTTMQQAYNQLLLGAIHADQKAVLHAEMHALTKRMLERIDRAKSATTN